MRLRAREFAGLTREFTKGSYVDEAHARSAGGTPHPALFSLLLSFAPS